MLSGKTISFSYRNAELPEVYLSEILRKYATETFCEFEFIMEGFEKSAHYTKFSSFLFYIAG